MATVALPGGPTLSYREWGRPDGAVVLMLHGLGSSSDTWRNVAPVIGERFRVIAFDARGHGDSEWTKEYSFEAMRDDVAGLMDQLGILAAIVVGHSMGAVTAYYLAATMPERIRLLVLEEMPAPDPAKPPRPYPREPFPDGEVDWKAVIALNRWRNNPPKSWWGLAGKIPSKTLMLGGTHSHLPQDRMRALCDAIPNAKFASLDRGHDIHTERPSEFLAVVEPFISWFAK
jgi:pimeloyl-ACP methyl ester carboxylesterase